MKTLNIKFQEEYKAVDRLIKDALDSTEGVSEYLRSMEANPRGEALVPCWREDYRMLKRLRWIRNKLAHEVSIDSDICNPEDYDWLKDFHRRLLKGGGALAEYEQRKRSGKGRGPGRSQAPGSSSRAASASGPVKQSSKKPGKKSEKRSGRRSSFGLILWILIIIAAIILVKKFVLV